MEHVREELERLITKGGYGYAAVSRLLGRNPSYIQQFIKRGSPRILDPEDGPNQTPMDGMIEVPVLDVDASAGFGAIASDESSYTRFGFDEKWLRRLTGAKGASLSIVSVLGDSMEPTLSDGDEVLVDASDHGSRLRDGIYVLRSDDTLVVKRIAIKPGAKQITISSDNPAYPSWNDVDREGVAVIGRVIWFGRAL
jgi:phage repressor protein C with HTH and peptisase S24 domain